MPVDTTNTQIYRPVEVLQRLEQRNSGGIRYPTGTRSRPVPVEASPAQDEYVGLHRFPDRKPKHEVDDTATQPIQGPRVAVPGPVLPHTPVDTAEVSATRLDIRVPSPRPRDPVAPKDALQVVAMPAPAEPAADVSDENILQRILRKLRGL